jgi:hypothetical protein
MGEGRVDWQVGWLLLLGLWESLNKSISLCVDDEEQQEKKWGREKAELILLPSPPSFGE